MTVTTMRRDMRPTAKARLPLAIWDTFGRNGAPWAQLIRISPIWSCSFIGMTCFSR